MFAARLPMHGATSAELQGPHECLFSLRMLSSPVFSKLLQPPKGNP